MNEVILWVVLTWRLMPAWIILVIWLLAFVVSIALLAYWGRRESLSNEQEPEDEYDNPEFW